MSAPSIKSVSLIMAALIVVIAGVAGLYLKGSFQSTSEPKTNAMTSIIEVPSASMWQQLREEAGDMSGFIDCLEAGEVPALYMHSYPAAPYPGACAEEALVEIRDDYPEWEAFEAISMPYFSTQNVNLDGYDRLVVGEEVESVRGAYLSDCVRFASAEDDAHSVYSCGLDALSDYQDALASDLQEAIVQRTAAWQHWEQYWAGESSPHTSDLVAHVRNGMSLVSDSQEYLDAGVCGDDTVIRTAALRVAVEDRVTAEGITPGEAANAVLGGYFSHSQFMNPSAGASCAMR